MDAESARALRSTRTLAWLSTVLCASTLVSVAALAAILAHWHDALNACTHADCGCLLYARAVSSSYAVTGSDVSVCWFVTTAPLPGLIAAAAFAAVYGYRGYIRNPHRRAGAAGAAGAATPGVSPTRGGAAGRLLPRTSNGSPPGAPGQQQQLGVTFGGKKTRASERQAKKMVSYTTQGVVCLLMGLFAVGHVAVLTDGFLASCREYRHAVLRTLRASGSLALLVNERLTCPVVYDFLDYMKPDARELFQDHHWFPGQRKLSTVNTAAALVISLLSAYACMVLWFVLAVHFGRRGRDAARKARQAALSSSSPTDRRQPRGARGQLTLHSTDL